MPSPPSPPPTSARFPVTDTYSCSSQTVVPCFPDPSDELNLCELVDVALQNSPKTRESWYFAKAAAAQLGTARGAYIPPLNFSGYWEKNQFSMVSLNTEAVNFQKTISLGFSSSYLLFDFGGRNANLASALAALAEANWNYCWEVQTVMIGTVKSYYDYMNAKGIKEATEITVQDKMVTLEATIALRVTGVRGLGDELQARTDLLQTQIELEKAIKALNIAYSNLLQSVGLPPDSCITIGSLPEKIETNGVCGDMALLLKTAKEHRSDLRAKRSFLIEQRAKVRSARSECLPKITNETSGTKVSLSDFEFSNNYHLRFNLDFPILSNFAKINDLRQAQAELFAAQASLDDEELQAYLEVLIDYYEFIANTQILKYSCNYLETAKKNQDVAFANYKVGITTIIDLMQANNALQTARIQMVEAKTEFLTSIANLAYSTGGLSLDDVKLDQTVSPEFIENNEVINIEPCMGD
ncbi:MAG: hypothetical protein S4CHLAM45_08790 [Chlamydiales bacterium]|nr:hypothetical protein [Chlamydiales bacterium]MCH9620371.1 hypothetical protein [Chlamydiales bacterium]MCH9622983.1 hypothetical protein [Chlamydiales bacterium]